MFVAENRQHCFVHVYTHHCRNWQEKEMHLYSDSFICYWSFLSYQLTIAYKPACMNPSPTKRHVGSQGSLENIIFQVMLTLQPCMVQWNLFDQPNSCMKMQVYTGPIPFCLKDKPSKTFPLPPTRVKFDRSLTAVRQNHAQIAAVFAVRKIKLFVFKGCLRNNMPCVWDLDPR